jgi:hypothetical protein
MSGERGAGRWRRRIAVASACAAVLGVVLSAGAAASTTSATRPAVTVVPTEVAPGDTFVVSVDSMPAGSRYLVSQCGPAGGAGAGQCGPWVGLVADGVGASVQLTAQACPDPAGRCSVRVVRVDGTSAGITGAPGSGGAAVTTDPGPDATLVQQVGLVIIDASATTTTATTSGSSTTTVTVQEVPLGPGTEVLGTQSGRPGTGAPGTEVLGEALAQTGASSTCFLVALALGLIDLGWLACSAVPRAVRRRTDASLA